MRQLVLGYKSLLLFAGLIYVITPLLEGEQVLPLTWITFCKFEERSYCYTYNYIAQLICIFNALYFLICFDSLFFILLSYCYCELYHLKHHLSNLKIEENCEGDGLDTLQQLAALVKQHNLVLE